MNKSIIGTLTDKTIKIRNLKEKEEYIKEVAILEHEEWAENPEENKKERIERKSKKYHKRIGIMYRTRSKCDSYYGTATFECN